MRQSINPQCLVSGRRRRASATSHALAESSRQYEVAFPSRRASDTSCTRSVRVLYNIDMVRISVSKAREKLSEVVEMSQSEPVELEHYGRRAAVIVSPDQYDEMLEALEESQDVAAFDEALAEVGENIPWEQVKIDLGWS